MARKDLLTAARAVLVLSAWLAATVVASAQPYSLFGMGQAGVISPRPIYVFNPWTYSPLFGAPSVALGFPRPLGHQHIPTGPNSYVYRPITDLSLLSQLAKQSIREADYQAALLNLEPVLKLSPTDGEAWLDESQALFGLERFSESATALHLSMRTLPREAWGGPVTNFRVYFSSPAEYTARLRALEAFVRENSGDAAGHYLLGYHYGYLGHSSHATRELQLAISLVAPDGLQPQAPIAELIPAPAKSGPREF